MVWHRVGAHLSVGVRGVLAGSAGTIRVGRRDAGAAESVGDGKARAGHDLVPNGFSPDEYRFLGAVAAWGGNPVGYHVVNVLLHGANAVLLWRVLARLKVPAGWLGGIIFAVHPVCVASVAWVSELKNTLSLCFYLLSLLCYLKIETPDLQSQKGKAAQWYVFRWGLFLLALFSKTSTVMLPVVLLGCSWWQRGRLAARDVLRTVAFFALALAFGLLSVWFQARGAIAGATVQTEGFGGRLAGAGMALWFYLGKALLPLNLSMIYPRWKIEAAAPASYLPLLLWCGMMACGWGFAAAGDAALYSGWAVSLSPCSRSSVSSTCTFWRSRGCRTISSICR